MELLRASAHAEFIINQRYKLSFKVSMNQKVIMMVLDTFLEFRRLYPMML